MLETGKSYNASFNWQIKMVYFHACLLTTHMHRCGTVDEAASMAAFIVSKEASFNTGHSFDLSGGRAQY